MRVNLVESKHEGDVWFIFVGVDTFEEFDLIADIIVSSGAVNIKTLDGIYSRFGFFEKSGLLFKLVYHEDVGNYLCLSEKGGDYNRLRNLAQKIAELLLVRV